MNPTRRVARTLLAGSFVHGGITALRYTGPRAEMLKQSGLPEALPDALPKDPVALVRINGAAQVVGGLALVTGRFPRLASLGLAASLAPTTVVGHAFWNEKDKAVKTQQQVHFLKNLGLLGGLVLSANDTGGRESVPHAAGRIAADARDSVSSRSSRKARKQAAKNAASFGHDALAAAAAMAHSAATSDTAKDAKKSARKAARQATAVATAAAATAAKASHDVARSDAASNAKEAARQAAAAAVQASRDAAASATDLTSRAREALPV